MKRIAIAAVLLVMLVGLTRADSLSNCRAFINAEKLWEDAALPLAQCELAADQIRPSL